MPVTLTFVLGNADHARLKKFKPGKMKKEDKDWSKATPEEIAKRYKENPGYEHGGRPAVPRYHCGSA